MGRHRFVEESLFELTGGWSTDAAGSDPADGTAEFFASQSANHAWRLAGWVDRSPRSPSAGVQAGGSGWTDALGHASSCETARERLACWTLVLAPALLAGYREHLDCTGGTADAGARRWLRIVTADVSEATATGAALLFGRGPMRNTDAAPTVTAICPSLEALLARGS